MEDRWQAFLSLLGPFIVSEWYPARYTVTFMFDGKTYCGQWWAERAIMYQVNDRVGGPVNNRQLVFDLRLPLSKCVTGVTGWLLKCWNEDHQPSIRM